MLIVAFLIAAAPAPAWEVADKNDHCTVYNRSKEGSDVKEVLAVGWFDASLEKVHAVLDDLENYKDFMPYTKESTILKRDGDVVWTYERINAPLVSERDYPIRVWHEKSDKGVVTHRFRYDPAHGPKEVDGVVRVTSIDGYWMLEPDPKAPTARTKGTYYVYTSPGGSVPTFVINGANNTAVPGLYETIKKRIKSQK
jgi:hypothetical protein